MENVKSLRDVIKFNNSFKSAINLYLSLNKTEKIEGYIPTKSSIAFMSQYIDAIIDNKEQATLLIGPYGKGKSHLLLVLLSVLSMDRNPINNEIIKNLIEKIRNSDETGSIAAKKMERIWQGKPYLPVLISNANGDLNQAFLYGLNDALKKNNISGLTPDTYYSIALDRISDWKKNYKDTYELFEQELKQHNTNTKALVSDLKMFSKEALGVFENIYPKVTSGSLFNPMVVSDVLPLYKNISEKLVEDYGYSGIYIVFDEFSKFIESQDGSAAGNNMKLLQDICELATDSKNAKVFFTMVAHKSIKEYGKYLSQDIINSFTGIEGRIIEKYFITSSKNNYELIKNAIIKDDDKLSAIPLYEKLLGKQTANLYYQVPAFKSKFSENDFNNIILKGCYPLNPIAAYLLLNVSEKVAQNERTLFTFISNDEPHSMARYIKEHNAEESWIIGADLIYDYFSGLFKKEVSNEYVHNIWLGTEYVINKCTSEDQKKIVKALAVIQIVNKEDEIPADDKYLQMCVDTIDYASAIQELKQNLLIYKKSSTGTYVFKTKAGSELKSEIKKQRELRGENVNYSQSLIDITGKYFYIPRRYNTDNYITRYFTNEYMSASDFLNIKSAKALTDDLDGDGKVITLYGLSAIKQDEVKEHLKTMADSRLVIICPRKGIKLFKQIRDYEIIQELKNNSTFTHNNEILKNELPLMLEDITMEIENNLYNIYTTSGDTKVFYYDGSDVVAEKNNDVEMAVNICCKILYSKSPIINNEIINRKYIGSSQTKKARLNIIQAIISHEDDEIFYSGSNQEATIYRSLFVRTQLLNKCASDNLEYVINTLNNFVTSCADKRRKISDVIDILTSAPIGMRLAVIPVYFSYVLANRKEDIIVYFSNNERQLTADIIISMCDNPQDYELFVSKEDVQKEKYISELNSLFYVEDNRNLTTNRIKNIIICMQRWFRTLPQAVRNLAEIDDYIVDPSVKNAMMVIKKSLQQVEFNPYDILFVTFRDRFNTTTLEETYKVVDECKTYYDDYYDWIVNQVIDAIHNVWTSRKKQDLYHMLKDWYNKQSKSSKQGLYAGRITNFMSCIENLDIYNDTDIAIRVVKAVTDVYVENWSNGSINDFKNDLASIKTEIEKMKDNSSDGEYSLSFCSKNGTEIVKRYTYADENTGSVLRNIIEDTLEEYDDLSVNDRVSILLEMIEKIIK